MQPARGDGLLSTAEAAQLVRVTPATIRKWRSRRDQDGQPYLPTQGLDERGRPLHTAEAVRAAERRVRERGLRTTGIDPRRLRQRPLAA